MFPEDLQLVRLGWTDGELGEGLELDVGVAVRGGSLEPEPLLQTHLQRQTCQEEAGCRSRVIVPLQTFYSDTH